MFKISLINKFIILLIDFYRYCISPLKPRCCRFYPSCSTYARDSYLRFGILKASILTFIRLIKCHPFHPGGFDPVPAYKNQE